MSVQSGSTWWSDDASVDVAALCRRLLSRDDFVVPALVTPDGVFLSADSLARELGDRFWGPDSGEPGPAADAPEAAGEADPVPR